jgi:hypothetical protein
LRTSEIRAAGQSDVVRAQTRLDGFRYTVRGLRALVAVEIVERQIHELSHHRRGICVIQIRRPVVREEFSHAELVATGGAVMWFTNQSQKESDDGFERKEEKGKSSNALPQTE